MEVIVNGCHLLPTLHLHFKSKTCVVSDMCRCRTPTYYI